MFGQSEPFLLTSKQIERVIQLVASLPAGSKAADDLTSQFVKTLWQDLQHPPMSYLGDEFKYRMADGSNNVSYRQIFRTLFSAVFLLLANF